jgi:hypothetical protein
MHGCPSRLLPRAIGTISFGTVGSQAITYSGSVSGDSMSGTYKVQTPNGSVGGSWSATKGS